MADSVITYSPRLSKSEQALLSLPSRLRNLRPFMETSVVPAAERMIMRHWDSKGAAFGHPWAPWAASTRAARLRIGNAAKGLLRDTDHLFKAVFRSLSDRIAAVIGGVRLSLQPDDPKWFFHQVGTSNMPERQVIPYPFPRSFTSEVRGLTRDFVLTGRVRGPGGRFVSTSNSTSAAGGGAS